MAYGGNPSTDTSDALRLRVWDTSTSTSAVVLSDAEVTFFLNNASNDLYAAANAAEAIAAKFSGNTEASRQKVGDLELEFGGGSRDLPGSYRNLAAQLRLQAALAITPYSGGISISDKQNQESDSDWERSGIEIGMHDNRTAGGTVSTGSF